MDALGNHLLVQYTGHVLVINYLTGDIIANMCPLKARLHSVAPHDARFLDSSRILVSYRNYATCVWDFMDPFVREQHTVAVVTSSAAAAPVEVKYRSCNVRELWQEVLPEVKDHELDALTSPLASIVAYSKDGTERCASSSLIRR
jgi:hypothetical protein